MAARDVQFIRHVYLGAHTLEIKKHIQTCLNDQNPESFEEMIIILSMFNNIARTKKVNREICFINTKKATTFAAQIQTRMVVLPGACVRQDVVERKSQHTSRTMGSVA